MSNPRPELTITQAVGYLKAFGKFVGFAITILSAVWYIRGGLDAVHSDLLDLHKTLLYKASIGDINHAFKTLGDQNRDVQHKDGSLGLLVPELLVPPTAPEVSPASTSETFPDRSHLVGEGQAPSPVVAALSN
jgi:hypothetical protein